MVTIAILTREHVGPPARAVEEHRICYHALAAVCHTPPLLRNVGSSTTKRVIAVLLPIISVLDQGPYLTLRSSAYIPCICRMHGCHKSNAGLAFTS